MLTFDNNLMLWKTPKHVHPGATAAFAFKQIVADEIEYDPAEHTPEAADSPVVAQYEPAVHDEHELEPVVD